MPGATPNPPEVPPSPGPIEDPVTGPDVIGVGMSVPGQEPDVPGSPMVD